MINCAICIEMTLQGKRQDNIIEVNNCRIDDNVMILLSGVLFVVFVNLGRIICIISG